MNLLPKSSCPMFETWLWRKGKNYKGERVLSQENALWELQQDSLMGFKDYLEAEKRKGAVQDCGIAELEVMQPTLQLPGMCCSFAQSQIKGNSFGARKVIQIKHLKILQKCVYLSISQEKRTAKFFHFLPSYKRNQLHRKNYCNLKGNFVIH